MRDLSSNARELLKAARADGPSTAARAKIWGDVAQATGVGGAVGAATAGALTSAGPATTVAVTASASKLLALGVLLGSAMTVGIAVALLRVVPVAAPSASVGAAPAPVAGHSSAPAAVVPEVESLTGGGERADAPSSLASPVRLDPARRDSRAVVVPAAPAPPIREAGEEALMREATLLAEARGALVRGDAQGALAKLRATERLPRRALVPEELSLKAHALRVVGRPDEADETEVTLRLRYPEHALSR